MTTLRKLPIAAPVRRTQAARTQRTKGESSVTGTMTSNIIHAGPVV